VGSPWCCATDSQFQSESPGEVSRAAYLRKFRRMCGSIYSLEAPRSRNRLVSRSRSASACPR
jgi:hypothetical protein